MSVTATQRPQLRLSLADHVGQRRQLVWRKVEGARDFPEVAQNEIRNVTGLTGARGLAAKVHDSHPERAARESHLYALAPRSEHYGHGPGDRSDRVTEEPNVVTVQQARGHTEHLTGVGDP